MSNPPPRDWDKELAEIDKLIARQPAPAQPPAPSRPASGAVAGPAALPAPPVPRHRLELTGWLRVLLGLVLGVAMTQWPYAHECGLNLYLYLGAAAAVVIAGIWGAVAAWKRQMAVAHVLSLLITLWGAVLAGREVLDRIGYSRANLTWTCPAASAMGPASQPELR